jgi:preprotein translocase subunit SecD
MPASRVGEGLNWGVRGLGWLKLMLMVSIKRSRQCFLVFLTLTLGGCGAIWDQMYPEPQRDASIGFYIAQADYAQGLLSSVSSPGGPRLYVQQQPIVKGVEIQSATPMVDKAGYFFVAIRLTDSGARKLAQATAEATDKQLALLVGGRLMGAAFIDSPIDKGMFAMATRDRASAFALADLLAPKR